MSTPPILVSPATSVVEAQRIMERRKVRHLMVAHEGLLVGIITPSDIRAVQPSNATTLSRFEWPALLEKVRVTQCMTRNPQTIAVDATVLEAGQRMLDHKIGCLPVVDGTRIVGIITQSDLLRLLIVDATGIADHDRERSTLVCHHCGTVLRGRSVEHLGPNDTCWHCHYHLHRCDNCRYFDKIGCLLDRPERQDAIPGQHCAAFSYLPLAATQPEELKVSKAG
jgi:CBS domain-containing protein